MSNGVCMQGRDDMEHEENMEMGWVLEHAGRVIVNGHECAVVGSFDLVMADLSCERPGVMLSFLASPSPRANGGRGAMYAPGLV